MKYLHLGVNKIKKIENISHMVLLKELYLGFNQILQISGLNALNNLIKLDLSYNKLNQIEGLEGQENSLLNISLSDNNIVDWSNIEYLGKTLKVCEALFIDNNSVYNDEDDQIDQRIIKEFKSLIELNDDYW